MRFSFSQVLNIHGLLRLVKLHRISFNKMFYLSWEIWSLNKIISENFTVAVFCVGFCCGFLPQPKNVFVRLIGDSELALKGVLYDCLFMCWL